MGMGRSSTATLNGLWKTTARMVPSVAILFFLISWLIGLQNEGLREKSRFYRVYLWGTPQTKYRFARPNGFFMHSITGHWFYFFFHYTGNNGLADMLEDFG